MALTLAAVQLPQLLLICSLYSYARGVCLSCCSVLNFQLLVMMVKEVMLITLLKI